MASIAFACSAYDEESSSPAPARQLPDAGAEASAVVEDSGTPAAPPSWLPAEGAYRYRVDGVQYLNVGNDKDRDEGPSANAEIRKEAAPGCWRFRLCLVSGTCNDAPSDAYSDASWTFCVDGGRLEARKQRELVHWQLATGFWQTFTLDVDCAAGQATHAAADLSLTSFAHACDGKANGTFLFDSSGPYRYLGEDTVMVGNTAVRAFHYAEDHRFSPKTAGAPTGRKLGEWWLAANGLPVRIRRGMTIDANFGFGSIEFRETAKTPYDAGPDAGSVTMNDCILDSLEPGPLPDAGN